jgi:hypothetical protein
MIKSILNITLGQMLMFFFKVFISVLAVHVLIIGGFTLYYLMLHS